MNHIVKNSPVHVSEISVIELLAEVKKRNLTENVWMLAEKFLPDVCAHRLGNSFRLDALKIISKLLVEDKEINDLRHICCQCEFVSICPIYRN